MTHEDINIFTVMEDLFTFFNNKYLYNYAATNNTVDMWKWTFWNIIYRMAKTS